MKIKRFAVMLVFAILIASIPIWAFTSQGEDAIRDRSDISYISDGVTIIDDEHPVMSFSVYGYGTVRAVSPTYGEFISGSQVDPGTVITFYAEGIGQDGFEFLGWRINGVPYRGPVYPSLTHTIYSDTHVMAIFDHPWANEPTPPPSSYTLVPAVNVMASIWGSVTIRIPGTTPPVSFEPWSTETTTEFRVYPPDGMYFDETTILNISENITLTFGPIVQGDGRLAFTMLNLNPNNDGNGNSADDQGEVESATAEDNNESSNYEENNDLNVVFQLEGGTMPSGTSASQSLAYGSVINPLPVPTRTGYTFVGWQVGGLFVAPPITVSSNLELRAIWAPVQSEEESEQFMVGFRPEPGAFPDTNETGIRFGIAGALITNMPQNPTRAGYVFGGWRLPNGNTLSGQMTVVGDMMLNAIWTRCPTASPTPAPSTSPGPSNSPAPSTSPQSGQRPNPQTSPLRISFMIFGIVIMGGVAFFGIAKLTKKQLVAEEQYNTDLTRFNREQRIIDLIEHENKND